MICIWPNYRVRSKYRLHKVGGARSLRANTNSYIGTVGLDFFGNIDRRPLRQYFLEQTMAANDAAQQQRMQLTDGDAEQAVSGRTDQEQRFVFEDLKTCQDAHVVIVSTAADGYPITARKITTEARASKWLGQMSDQSLQALSRDKVAIPSASTNSATNGEAEKGDEGFLKHGPGRTVESAF
ncbi:hypothetical protein O988_03793 [Pseudogymnoascus sp. VKM F-3808]|nr:hypothetical protein O988_03793 [Pseudogymnoascus sp. VKM F-3808]